MTTCWCTYAPTRPSDVSRNETRDKDMHAEEAATAVEE